MVYRRIFHPWLHFSREHSAAWIEQIPQAIKLGGRSIFVASLVATTLVTGLKKLGALQPFELNSFDTLMRLRHHSQEAALGSQHNMDPRLLIVGVAETDLQVYGWPLSDQVVATALQIIQQHQPQVIGLDVYRNTPQPPGRAELAQQLAADNVIAIWNAGDQPVAGEVPGPPTMPWERMGFNDLAIDPDGVLRRSLLFVDNPERPYYSFALRVVEKSLAGGGTLLRTDADALYLGKAVLPRLKPWSGGYQSVDNGGYQILTRYRSSQVPAQHITVEQLLAGQFDPAWIRDRIVLIGTTAASLKDEFYTPYSAGQRQQFTQSGVVVHAQIISQLLDATSGRPAVYRWLPQGGEFVWLVAWSGLAGLLAWAIRQPVGLLAAGGLLLLGLWGAGAVGLTQLVWLPVFEPTVGLLLTGGLVLMLKALHRSTHDWITNLPGRDMFLEQVRRALHTQESDQVIVAFLDINRFKLINQSLGHTTGDHVLQVMAARLRQTLPEGTHVARVGGDEFVLLFQQKSLSVVEDSLDQLQKALAEPLCLNQHRLSITASVGLAIAQAHTGSKPEDLLRDAHTAMYRAKALDEFSCEVFSRRMREEAVQRLQLESHLLEALDKQEFVLYYQPIVQLETGRVAGFEALVRWQHQERGFVTPGDFIPVVEETGLIIELGQWIFREACQQLWTWQQQVPDYELKMSINLSRRQFMQPDLVQQMAVGLEESGIVGEQVQLEITESMIMRDVEASQELMLNLKALGLALAIDDFGTGYSSLSYLHRFPTDTLKIDRSFVGRMEHSQEDREIVHTIITLGHKLNLTLVAEGIETAEQMALLRQMGCQYGQGYWFSRPVTAADAIALLTRQVPKP